MKPVLILQNDASQSAGNLHGVLEQASVRVEVVHAYAGDKVPSVAKDFSGIAVLGSNASVNDNFSWIHSELGLLSYALRADIPVLGHCFGAQLLAKSMGAQVAPNPMPQIGWGTVYTTQGWLHGVDAVKSFEAFHWHYDSFSIPEGGQRILFGGHCLNKGFKAGKHMGLQCHLEITEASLRQWCNESADELVKLQSCPMVQQADEILRMIPVKLPGMQRVADRVYREWAAGLARPRTYYPHQVGLG